MTMDLDFEADELVMLRQLFRDEAHDALEAVTTRILAAGSAPPQPDALAEMMRVTHTIKGAAGTVGLAAMVDLAHRLESAFAAVGRESASWTRATADLVVEITDGLHGFVDQLVAGEPDRSEIDATVVALRAQIARIADVPPDRPSVSAMFDAPFRASESMAIPTIVEAGVPEPLLDAPSAARSSSRARTRSPARPRATCASSPSASTI